APAQTGGPPMRGPTMGRPRKRDRPLPPCVYHRHGGYYLVKAGKWTPLGRDYDQALLEYARPIAQDKGGMEQLIEDALPGILKDKAPSTQKQYREAARRLQHILEEFAPHQVTPRDVAQLRRSLSDSYAVANRVLSVLRMVFDYALDEQLVESN